MTKLTDLKDLFYYQLSDIYDAETQMISALPEMAKNASSNNLKKVFFNHLKKAKQHKKRLEIIAEDCGINIIGETSQAMKGLLKETKSTVSKDVSDKNRDSIIIIEARRIEKYKISIYETAIQFAKKMHSPKNIDRLQQSLNEEKDAERILVQIAESNVNKQFK